MNATYTSEKMIQEMVFIMSEILEMKILKGMRKSDHFSILLDEMTDCTITEQLAVHGCLITSTGELSCCFLICFNLYLLV